jgi:1-acyl-sn-glycerol-3-phosphate acyltransferase
LRLPRALWRIARALVHVLRGIFICAFIFPRLDRSARMAHVGRWNTRMLQLLGITVRGHGTPLPGPVLLVANHVSWLDILAINAVHTARFVSKADVRHWPVLGWLVACGGTLFIERERKRDAMRVVHQVAAALDDGDVIAMFPEGTTSDGHGLLPFHANLMQAAVATGAPVQPVALRFSDADEAISSAAAYIGDMTLLQSLWRIVWAERLCVDVTLLAPLPTQGLERREVSDTARRSIAGLLQIKESTEIAVVRSPT